MATTGEKQVMVIGTDESEQSTYALEWTLDHFFAPFGPNSPFKLVIVHAKPMPSSVRWPRRPWSGGDFANCGC
ncbi:universal stress protein PHOS34 [Prunus yedoensis var. nudiflora]|uniref:Universal stress protein PHOS34 n=1 Tax=Prunus yedoensis var. nudiflora TaxID=2094558 RepID=A0A314Y7F5_PRUYE|nr:universal stress protein PHOS34 [Prunus yedoensis var. nudiflora]